MKTGMEFVKLHKYFAIIRNPPPFFSWERQKSLGAGPQHTHPYPSSPNEYPPIALRSHMALRIVVDKKWQKC